MCDPEGKTFAVRTENLLGMLIGALPYIALVEIERFIELSC